MDAKSNVKSGESTTKVDDGDTNKLGTSGKQQAKNLGYPDAPEGYSWRKGPNGEPTLRSRTKGNDKLTFDPNSGKFKTSSGKTVKTGQKHTFNNKSFNKASSPLRIPKNASVTEQIKNGYTQVKFKWTRGNYKYEARWHTPTNPKFKAQGNTWVITRTTPGNSTVLQQVNHIWTGKKWSSMSDWQNAISAQKTGAATESQKALLESGHHKSY